MNLPASNRRRGRPRTAPGPLGAEMIGCVNVDQKTAHLADQDVLYFGVFMDAFSRGGSREDAYEAAASEVTKRLRRPVLSDTIRQAVQRKLRNSDHTVAVPGIYGASIKKGMTPGEALERVYRLTALRLPAIKKQLIDAGFAEVATARLPRVIDV